MKNKWVPLKIDFCTDPLGAAVAGWVPVRSNDKKLKPGAYTTYFSQQQCVEECSRRNCAAKGDEKA